MSDHPLVQSLHAAISRRSWNAVEQAANAIRDNRQISWPNAALAQPEAVEPVAVKPLEWRTHKGDDFCDAHYDSDAIGGSYTIEARKTGAFDLWKPNVQSGRYASIDDAKAAAQSDYEQRIRSAITTPPLAPDERMRRALEKIIGMNVQYAKDRYGDATKAEDMACVRVAREALSSADEGKESEGGVEGHASEETATVAASGKRESRPRDLEAAGSQREAEAGWPGESPRVKEQASNRESQDSDRIGGPAAARCRAGIKPGPSDPTPPNATAQREAIARNIEMAWAIEPTPFNRADVAARVAIYFLQTRAGG